MNESRITHLQANRFIRNALTGKENQIDSPFLAKLDIKINSIGQYIKQKHGEQAFNDLVRFVHPHTKRCRIEMGVKVK